MTAGQTPTAPMLGATLLVTAARAASAIPVPFAEGKVFQDETGRYMLLESEPTLGAVRQTISLTAGAADVNLPSSECMWGSYESVLFLGPPPKACRRGKRFDGWSLNGFAVVHVTDAASSVDADVHYPVANVSAPHASFGPFTMCNTGANGIRRCKAEPYSAVEVYGNSSSVWVQDPSFTAQSSLFQGLGIAQAVLFALMAARGKNVGRESAMNKLMALAADAAVGGALTQTWLLSTGRSFVGLDVEIGMRRGSYVEASVTAWCVALATCAYVHAAIFNANRIAPSFQLDQYVLPFQLVLRELCEIPLLVSLVIIWPESSGPHFLQQLQFMCGLAVSYVSGRACGLLQHYGSTPAESVLCAAFVLIGGISTATAMGIGTIASCGAIVRGSPSVAFTLTLQIHVAAGGIFFGTRSRIAQMSKAVKGSPEAMKASM